MNGSIQWLGFAGMSLVVVAYVLQVRHLVRARCTGGVSTWAYLVWSVSGVLLLAYAMTERDPVFISLQAYQLVATTSIYLFSKRCQGEPCNIHCGTSQSHRTETVATQISG